MDSLHELYEEVILDHNKSPRNFKKVPAGANHQAQGDNPLCGDQYKIYLKINQGVIEDVGFDGTGCAISKASASLMLEAVKGKTPAEAETLFQEAHDFITGEPDRKPLGPDLEKLEVLSGVRDYPMRVKCATLAWHILNAALHNQVKKVSTE